MVKSPASPAQPVNLNGLFTDLNRCEQSGDFEKAHKICNKIIASDKNNVKARHCKIICKIQMGQIEEALKEIEKANSDIKPFVTFEKAYCEYKLNQIDNCLKTLDSIETTGLREKELQAQALYRQEQYSDCYKIYVDLIRNSDDEYEAERATNLTATVACLNLLQDKSVQHLPELGESTFEQYYNKACSLIGKQNFGGAIDKLRESEDVCKQTMDEEGATEEEIEAELNLIRAQVAYAYQRMGNNKQALEIYNQLLKQKPTDSALVSVINNNLVAINQEQNIFDSKKRMKTAVTELANAKLLSLQKKNILLNNAILHLQTNQNGLCRQQLNEFRMLFPEEDTHQLLLIEVALLKKERKIGDAKQLLEQTIGRKSFDDEKLELILVLAQILLEQNDVKSFGELLNKFHFVCQHLGIVSTVVGAQINAQDKTAAMESLNVAIEWYKKHQPTNLKNLTILYREVVKLMSENNQLENAITVLEELRRIDPHNLRIISQLIRAYSVVDVEKARQICKELPLIEQLIADVDIDSIESVNWSGGSKYIKKTAKSSTEVPEKKSSKTTAIKSDTKEKRKRKRKAKLPKNFDPNVKPDVERWLPKWQRSTYKKRKNDRKHNVGKGTQGAVGGPDVVESVAAKQSPRAVGTSPMPALNRQQRVQKKKKGGRR